MSIFGHLQFAQDVDLIAPNDAVSSRDQAIEVRRMLYGCSIKCRMKAATAVVEVIITTVRLSTGG
ncbi:MAG TPA: hypothetical protein VJ717_20055 [Gemmatimonadaceae bacterium]|nr:hypothetical protein [Gemmatimonadaceae bacterium]